MLLHRERGSSWDMHQPGRRKESLGKEFLSPCEGMGRGRVCWGEWERAGASTTPCFMPEAAWVGRAQAGLDEVRDKALKKGPRAANITQLPYLLPPGMTPKLGLTPNATAPTHETPRQAGTGTRGGWKAGTTAVTAPGWVCVSSCLPAKASTKPFSPRCNLQAGGFGFSKLPYFGVFPLGRRWLGGEERI